MKTYTYEETLDKVEQVIISSSLRNYCSKVCKGQCCNGCFTSNKNACHLKEGRRLSCSVYLCSQIQNELHEVSNLKIYNYIYYKMHKMISKTYMLVSFRYENPYFHFSKAKFKRLQAKTFNKNIVDIYCRMIEKKLPIILEKMKS